VTKIGDVFEVPISETEKKYFQLIAFYWSGVHWQHSKTHLTGRSEELNRCVLASGDHVWCLGTGSMAFHLRISTIMKI